MSLKDEDACGVLETCGGGKLRRVVGLGSTTEFKVSVRQGQSWLLVR